MIHRGHHAPGLVSSECLGHFWRVWLGKFWRAPKGWNNGSSSSALGGKWTPLYATTWTSNASTMDYDIGLLAMHDSTGTGCGGDKGQVIGNYTGWLGYSYNGDYSQRQWNIFGYPQAAPFEGNYLYQNNGATGALNPQGDNNVVEVGNPQSDGTSGGPWILGFDPNGATDPNPTNNIAPSYTNLINGVNSFKFTNPSQPLAINGPEFQTYNFWNLYTNYTHQTCK
jgi:hypothetical protein